MNDEYAGVENTKRDILATLKAAHDCGVDNATITRIAGHPDLAWYLQPVDAQRELASILASPAPSPAAPAPKPPKCGP